MPIRFQCPNCQQRLSVGRRKAGSEAVCPKCKQALRVPTEADDGSSEQRQTVDPGSADASDALPSNDFFDEFVVYDDEPLVADDVEVVAAPTNDADVDYSKVAVPRWAVFTQALLIGIVGVACFAFGLMIGSRTSGESAPREPVPCVITGSIEFRDNANQVARDPGAVVIALPQEARPEQKIDATGLSPLQPEPLRDDPRMASVRALGGAYARTDAEGEFRLRVPDKGNYFILMISRGKRQGDADAFDPTAAAQMGRFFAPVLDLIGDQAYSWNARTVRSDVTIQHLFQ